jgi:hypothetical protein
MKHISTLVAVPVLACGAVLAVATQASAGNTDPQGGGHGESAVVVHEPGLTVAVDDNVAEGLQAGASAIGGAGIALAALWAYRRRPPFHVS